MNAGKAVYGILSTTTAVTDIVGTKIYPEIAEQEAVTPFVVYQLMSVAPEDTHDGPSKLDEVRFEFLCYADTYNGAADLADAVRGALDRVSGTYNAVNVESAQFNNVDTEILDNPRRYSQVMVFTFRIKRDGITIAMGGPVTGAVLGDLNDVNVAGVTNDQVLSYDSASNTWVPATDGGAISLDDLTDVIISNPDGGEFFRYDGGEWVNDTAAKGDVGLGNVDNTSDANKPVSTAAQTALDLKADITSVPTDLDDLDDVQIIGTPTLGQALVYGAGKWLPGAAGATTLGDLDDVNTTGAAFGSLLTFNGSSWDISGGGLPTDDIYFHQRYETESEALRAGATATVELYFTCTAQGNGLAESASSDTPTTGYVINRKIYYSEAGFADPDTGTWVEFTPAPADDATFATVKAALLEYLKARTGGTVPISLKQTWEETAEATDLLDTYTGAAAGYSLRRIKSTETVAIRVRRSSDNTEQDIGFSAGELDTTSLLAFVGTGGTDNGYVKTWYDQSGNSNDATQTTTSAQPQIVSSGAVIVDANGKPRVQFDGVDDSLSFQSATGVSTEMDLFVVAEDITQVQYRGIYSLAPFSSANRDWNDAGGRFMQMEATAGEKQFYSNSGALSIITGSGTGQYLIENAMSSGTAYFWHSNTQTEATDTYTFTPLEAQGVALCSRWTNGYSVTSQANVYMSEFIVYPSFSAVNRASIRTNVNTFYSIF